MMEEDEPGSSGWTLVDREESEEEAVEEEMDISHMGRVPLEILAKIFSHFDLPTRGYASMVCRRWRFLLLSPRCPMENVVVMNIFERAVWEGHVKNNKGVRVKTIQMKEVETLKNITKLISEANTVKFWYKNEEFAKQCIDMVCEAEMDLKTVDLYPYGSELVTDKVLESMPSLSGMTMRPHEKTFFWSGLDMHRFPAFNNLLTLCVDTINFSEDVVLPTSLTALEFLNRNQEKHFNFLKIISPLKNLESLSMSHGDFSKNQDFTLFLDTIDASNLPKLAFLTLKFCKFPEKVKDSSYVGDNPEFVDGYAVNERQMVLKMLKVDLCYGPMDHIGKLFLEINKHLQVVVIQIMNDVPVLEEVARLSVDILLKKAWLHLALMQRDGIRRSSSEREDVPTPVIPFPPAFFKVLSKFEGSFIEDTNKYILDQILLGDVTACQDVKLINCAGATDKHLEALCNTSRFLRRMSIISCDNITEAGILPFFFGFSQRLSQKLEIVWKRRSRYPRPANLYLDIAHKYREQIKGKRLRFSTKTFSEDCDGERVMLWEKGSRKRLYLQDFSEPDEYRIIGVVVGRPEEEAPQEPPPPVPEAIQERLTKLLSKTSV